MRKFRKYFMVVGALAGFLFLFAFTRIPGEAMKAFFTVRRAFKQVALKEKPSYSEKFDVITSASVRIDDSDSERTS